jgi:hypothetical protein
VMRNLRLLLGGGLGGADVHPPVHLHGVDADQLDRWPFLAELPRQLKSDRRFARRGGANQGQMGQTATTGIRVLWRGEAVTSCSSPLR